MTAFRLDTHIGTKESRDMVDPLSLAALVTILSGVGAGVTSEAGRQLLEGLRGLVTRFFPDTPETGADIDSVSRGTASDSVIERVATALRQRALTDEEFRAELSSWLGAAHTQESIRTSEDNVLNVVGGQTRITGGLLQGRDFSGTFTFGPPAAPKSGAADEVPE